MDSKKPILIMWFPFWFSRQQNNIVPVSISSLTNSCLIVIPFRRLNRIIPICCMHCFNKMESRSHVSFHIFPLNTSDSLKLLFPEAFNWIFRIICLVSALFVPWFWCRPGGILTFSISWCFVIRFMCALSTPLASTHSYYSICMFAGNP